MFRLAHNDVPKQLRHVANLMELLPSADKIANAEDIIANLQTQISELQSEKNALVTQGQPIPATA